MTKPRNDYSKTCTLCGDLFYGTKSAKECHKHSQNKPEDTKNKSILQTHQVIKSITKKEIKKAIKDLEKEWPAIADFAQPQKAVLALYPACGCNMSEVSRVTGVPRRTIGHWHKTIPAFKAVCDDMLEVDLDESEARLRGIAHSNHPQALTGLIFRLKSLRRQVYGDQVQHGGSIEHKHVACPVDMAEIEHTIEIESPASED